MKQVALLLVLGGCKVVDAPKNLEQLMVFGFVHFADEPEYPVATVDQLRPLVRKRADGLDEGYRVDALGTRDLREAGIEGVPDDVSTLGVASRVQYRHDLDDVAWALTFGHMEQVLETTTSFEVEPVDNTRACFLAMDCETYAIAGKRRTDLGLFGESEQDFTREFRWVEADEGLALTVRDLAPEPAWMSVDVLRVEQQYSYSVHYAKGGGTERVEAYWVEVYAAGFDVPDAIALDNAVKQMGKTAEAIDAFIDERRSR